MNSKPARERKPPKKITETYLHNAGLYYLQRFAASSGQFREVMMRKVRKSCRFHTGQDPAACSKMVDDLVEKFTGAGLINDESYARAVITSMRRQGKSQQAIHAKLKVKGIKGDLVREQLNLHDENSTDSELQAALVLARKKKIGPYAVSEYDHEKALAAMARAGFSYDIAQKILRMDLEDAQRMTDH